MLTVRLTMLMLVEVVDLDSGSSVSSASVPNLEIHLDRIQRLAEKIVVLMNRKGKKNCTKGEIVDEYWACRFAALWYEHVLSLKFDNEAEVVASLKVLIGKSCVPLSEGGGRDG
jgi:hypothetical protein